MVSSAIKTVKTQPPFRNYGHQVQCQSARKALKRRLCMRGGVLK